MAETLCQLTKLVQDLGARLTAENLEMRARLHQIDYRLGTLEQREGQEPPKPAPTPRTGAQRRKQLRGERSKATSSTPVTPRPRRKKTVPAPDPEAEARAQLAQELKARRDGQLELPATPDGDVPASGVSGAGE